MLRRWVFAVFTLVLACQAVGDGKAFLRMAAPLAESGGSTMPRQRAIIAWDGAEQRLAIDTAFTGEGAEFAWLVPLPSEPEILPATRGMFDTAAVLTSPRIEPSDSGGMMFVGVVLVIAAMGAMTLKSLIGRIGLAIVVVVFGLFGFLPALGKARGGSGAAVPVEVVSTGTAGIYETAVLRARDADELIQWLRGGGYGVPEGVEAVVQDYLDKGWVFAAAKLAVGDPGAAEHRAHPLQFRFATGTPVYPMALTAVGNEDIELELFVFADGSASGNHLRAACSLETRPDTRDPDDTNARLMLRERPVTIAHPGLADIAGRLGGLTRLVGTLTPAQQREDIAIEITPFVAHDPGYDVPGGGITRGLGVGLIVAGALGLVLAMTTVDARQARGVLARQQGRAIAIMAVVGLAVGAGVALATPVYRGELVSGRVGLNAESTLRSLGQHLPAVAEEQHPADKQAVLALFEACAPEEFVEALREGDGPLHYRLEAGDAEASLWFVWHDAIGGEHRSRVPIAQSEPLGLLRFDAVLRQDLDRFDQRTHERFTHDIELGCGVVVPVEVAFTTKGNGTMRCLNVNERIYDAHDDGTLYFGGFSSVVFVDVNGDGYRDLVIGTAVYETLGDGGPAPDSVEYVQSVFTYQPHAGAFSNDLIR